jgi:hypothetical protein
MKFSLSLRDISLKVKVDDVFVPVTLHNFSDSGVLFESPFPCDIGSHPEFAISASESLSREIAFTACVKHCRKKNNAFFVGAAIESAEDSTWFRIFTEVHDFIKRRQGDIY